MSLLKAVMTKRSFSPPRTSKGIQNYFCPNQFDNEPLGIQNYFCANQFDNEPFETVDD